jgi:hypothetical protein
MADDATEANQRRKNGVNIVICNYNPPTWPESDWMMPAVAAQKAVAMLKAGTPIPRWTNMRPFDNGFEAVIARNDAAFMEVVGLHGRWMNRRRLWVIHKIQGPYVQVMPTLRTIINRNTEGGLVDLSNLAAKYRAEDGRNANLVSFDNWEFLQMLFYMIGRGSQVDGYDVERISLSGNQIAKTIDHFEENGLFIFVPSLIELICYQCGLDNKPRRVPRHIKVTK